VLFLTRDQLWDTMVSIPQNVKNYGSTDNEPCKSLSRVGELLLRNRLWGSTVSIPEDVKNYLSNYCCPYMSRAYECVRF
jgi:hypothetical protein